MNVIERVRGETWNKVPFSTFQTIAKMTVYTWRQMKTIAGSIGEIWEKIKTYFMWGQVNQKATFGEMEDLCDQSCINPICEGDINAALRIDDATLGDMGDVCVESYSSTVGGAGGTQTDARDLYPFTASNVFGTEKTRPAPNDATGHRRFPALQYRHYVRHVPN
ncbi:uncharacterized protein LOC101759658 [Setaria italica]|uniref:uncharacterized protein LOC101759658 n=1 Tax=Setaria italica TaxID=4555 RepID=UPI000BE5F41D|nr:uncharacterized protein LOC101759658 [Setaria italica]XP_022684371.1 uncharacterized protein LOC101759658 [Setaria italica]